MTSLQNLTLISVEEDTIFFDNLDLFSNEIATAAEKVGNSAIFGTMHVSFFNIGNDISH